jgi:hypothetical protein
MPTHMAALFLLFSIRFLPARLFRNRFLGFLNVYKIGLWDGARQYKHAGSFLSVLELVFDHKSILDFGNAYKRIGLCTCTYLNLFTSAHYMNILNVVQEEELINNRKRSKRPLQSDDKRNF